MELDTRLSEVARCILDDSHSYDVLKRELDEIAHASLDLYTEVQLKEFINTIEDTLKVLPVKNLSSVAAYNANFEMLTIAKNVMKKKYSK